MEEIEFEEYGDIRKVVIEGYHVKYIETPEKKDELKEIKIRRIP
tara:strand:+ start:454 stop:585 length:132 start_codon:yes stop_codon:yes gene_type:complete